MYLKSLSVFSISFFGISLIFGQNITFCAERYQSNGIYVLEVRVELKTGSDEEIAAYGLPIVFNNSSLALRTVEYEAQFWDHIYFDSNEEVMENNRIVNSVAYDRMLWVWGIDLDPSTEKTIGSDQNMIFTVYFDIIGSGASADIAKDGDLVDAFYNHYDGTEFPTTGACDVILPVELSQFQAKIHTCSIQISWTTVSELDNSHFELGYSRDGKQFKKLATIAGAGTSVHTQQYTYDHELEESGTYYYRLKQVDFSGNATYSKVIVANALCKDQSFLVFPNPIVQGTTAEVTFLNDYERPVWTLYDIIGRPLESWKKVPRVASDKVSLDLSAYASGIYFLQDQKGNSQRIVIQ